MLYLRSSEVLPVYERWMKNLEEMCKKVDKQKKSSEIFLVIFYDYETRGKSHDENVKGDEKTLMKYIAPL